VALGLNRPTYPGLAPGIGELQVFDGAGHFLWLDDPDGFFGAVSAFVERSVSP
jgi:pimeloyl-ACP methyl ester carboxylesterase